MGLGVHATVRREMKLELHHTININLCHLPDPRTLEAIEALARVVAAQGDSLMTLSAAVLAKTNEIKAALDAAVAGITADIQALKDQIAAGGMTEAEILLALDGIASSAQAVTNLDLANPGVPPVPPDEV